MSAMSRITLAALLTSAALFAGTAFSSAQEAKHSTDQGDITLAEHRYAERRRERLTARRRS